MKVLIVEDEPIAQNILLDFCGRISILSTPDVADNAIEAFEMIKQQQYDLLLLDIQMPEMDGLTLAKLLPYNSTNIIFTTAYSEYTLDAFELNVVDYLMKPFSYERFQKAIQKVLSRKMPEATPAEDAIFIKVDGQFRKCRFHSILYIEALSDYVKIHTTEGSYLYFSTMKAMEERLPANKFFRIHNSYIVAIEKVETLFGNTVQITNGVELPIARNRKEKLFELLKINE
ncbi:LytTR family DNA-binding domain-containing protein [Chitinophaga sancti]|uniref:LytR/AlgR family response regulator transcription factor n=1 Tax=Chitinophaga sancti TaxID=1004 RepID=UPI002A751E9F|nr:LytTR family DNA-binding domain-containing protein [Chitinophaga sancti]WPQ63437.1 LytTR family DNA-binding domain-containing protein [Chitinophaga sancti]